MNHYNKLGPTEIIPPLVAVAGTIVWISIDGFTGESIAQSLTALCTMFVILIPIYKHILKKPKDTHLETGIKACIQVQQKYTDLVTGPKFRKDDYTPGTPHSDHLFLFIQKPESRRMAPFVAISPFKKAIFEISISPLTLEILNITDDFTKVNHDLHDSVLSYAHKHYEGLYLEQNVEKFENICLVLDFDIEKVNMIEFHNIVQNLTGHAVATLIKMQA